ncbi:MAG: hypothetical protein N3E52_00415 [Candidatus Bathyarchaeota archaeon]|nr:hypothetical protein [Candidatus Bathyarchaeota archaeon]
MPETDEQKKERSKISLRIGEIQVEMEGTPEEITKLMGKDLLEFTKSLQETKKPIGPSVQITHVPAKAPEIISKTSESTPKASPINTITTEISTKPSSQMTTAKILDKKLTRKPFDKKVNIVLGLACITLAAGLIGALALYMPLTSSLERQIAEKDRTILSLNTQILSLNGQITTLNSQVTSLQEQLNQTNESMAALQSAIMTYRSIVYLNESMYLFSVRTITQEANTTTVAYEGELIYAGYISIAVESNSTTTYVRIIYYYKEVKYDQNVTVGTNGATAFPVLPGPIQIILGNTERGDTVTATLTARYYY